MASSCSLQKTLNSNPGPDGGVGTYVLAASLSPTLQANEARGPGVRRLSCKNECRDKKGQWRNPCDANVRARTEKEENG